MRVEDRTPRQLALLRTIEQARAQFPGPGAVLVNATQVEEGCRRVIEDAVLPPPAKVLWLVLAGGTAPTRPFPPTRTLRELTNIRSSSVFNDSLEILRINRWVTVSKGTTSVPVYVLQSSPLPLEDVVVVDAGYEAHLEQARSHGRQGIRMLAVEALRELRKGQRIRGDAGKDRWAFARPTRRTHGHGSGQMQLTLGYTSPKDFENDAQPTDPESEGMIYPIRWAPEQTRLAKRYLSSVKSSLRQAVLDELEGRVAAAARGAPPVYDELRFLKRLCDAALAGTFEPNLGGPVRRQREREDERRAAHRPRAVGPKEDARNDAAAARAFDQIWVTLGRASSDPVE